MWWVVGRRYWGYAQGAPGQLRIMIPLYPGPRTHLQALDLRPLELQPGLQLPDLGLLPAHQRLVHHGLL